MQGVYQITNKKNGKKYIGSSVDIKVRWDIHKARLNGGYHKNPHLQNAWNKYGEKAFVIEMLEETESLLEREQWYLDNVVEWRQDYNIARCATSPMKGKTLSKETKRKIGEAHKGMTHSEESKRKISEILTGRTLSEEHKCKLREKTLSEETKREISEANRGENNPGAKLTAEQVWEIHTLYATGDYTQEQLGRKFGVSWANIGYIVRGESWTRVYKKFHRRY